MKFVKRLFLLLIVGIIIIGCLKIKEGYTLFQEAIEGKPMEEMVNEIKSKKNYTTLDEMPEMYKKAVVAVEDHRFYTHKGVDALSIARAIWNDITTMKLAEGGSSITQQLSKNTYFTQEKKLTRKIAEIFMAIEYEKNYSKNDILEFYLNTSYFGDGCYTVKEATRKFFNKEPIEMNDYECIMLAGTPNAPSVYAPTINLDLAKERQLQVIQKMIRYNVLTEEEAKEILENE